MTWFVGTKAGSMTGYVLHPVADLQQDDIWKDTVEKWGEKQAIAYIRGLHAHLQRLC